MTHRQTKSILAVDPLDGFKKMRLISLQFSDISYYKHGLRSIFVAERAAENTYN